VAANEVPQCRSGGGCPHTRLCCFEGLSQGEGHPTPTPTPQGGGVSAASWEPVSSFFFPVQRPPHLINVHLIGVFYKVSIGDEGGGQPASFFSASNRFRRWRRPCGPAPIIIKGLIRLPQLLSNINYNFVASLIVFQIDTIPNRLIYVVRFISQQSWVFFWERRRPLPVRAQKKHS